MRRHTIQIVSKCGPFETREIDFTGIEVIPKPCVLFRYFQWLRALE